MEKGIKLILGIMAGLIVIWVISLVIILTMDPKKEEVMAYTQGPNKSVDESQIGHDDIYVMVNGEPISFNVAPQIIDGRTLLPLKEIFEYLGLDVTWDAETRTFIASNQENQITLTVNKVEAMVNGQATNLEVPPKIFKGRTMVPVKFIAESMNMNVSWDETTRTVYIN